MNDIVRPVSADGMCGYDQFGQFAVSWREGAYVTLILARDVRRETCAICLRGWEATSDSLRDQMWWDILESAVHESCFVRHSALVERAVFARAMSKAKFRRSGFRATANKYWPKGDPWAAKPWYEIDLLDHPVTIVLGSRKNVVHVEARIWDGSKFDASRADAAFAAENVTKEFDDRAAMLHAWGDEKVVEYLTRFRELLEDGWVSRVAT